jgi:YegS/Rv2252/BmrU family lipid kinase
MLKTLVIFNPSAGRAADGMLDLFQRPRDGAALSCTIHETAPDENTGAFVRERLRDGFNLVVAAGGDGTIAAAIDGLAGSGIPLGIVPIGTGNLVARELGIPLDPEAAIDLLLGPHRQRTVDVMRINGRYFLLNASVGVSAAIIRDTTSRDKRHYGRGAYVARAVAPLLRFRRPRLTLIVDDSRRRLRTPEVAVLNCGRLSGSIYPNDPDVQADDGWLDVWLLRLRTLPEGLWYLLKMAVGYREPQRAIHLRARRHVIIRCAVPQPVQADGEIIGTTPVTIEILPGMLSVLVP